LRSDHSEVKIAGVEFPPALKNLHRKHIAAKVKNGLIIIHG